MIDWFGNSSGHARVARNGTRPTNRHLCSEQSAKIPIHFNCKKTYSRTLT